MKNYLLNMNRTYTPFGKPLNVYVFLDTNKRIQWAYGSTLDFKNFSEGNEYSSFKYEDPKILLWEKGIIPTELLLEFYEYKEIE